MEFEASSAQATLAHYWDDAPTDTLVGAQELPIIVSEPNKWWSALYAFLIVIAIFWVYSYIDVWRRSQREKAFQRDLRRRHGIPDSDTRPFPIAYQEASIAARDAKRQSQSTQPEQQLSAHNSQNATSSVNVVEGFRPQARARPPIPTFPGQPPTRVPSGNFTFGPTQPHAAPNSAYDSSRAYSHHPHSASTPSWGPGYDATGARATSVPMVPTVSSRSAFAVAAASASRRSNGIHSTVGGTGERRTWSSAARPVIESRSTGNVSQARARKRLYLTADEEHDDQPAGVPNDKRSRTAGWGSEAMIDGDNEPLWAQSYPVEAKPASDQYASQTGKSRGKRLADDADGDLRAEGKRRHTKSSKTSRPKPSVVQETRGTKRERKEIDTASAFNDVMPVHKRGRAGDVDLSMVQEEDDAEEEDDPTVSRDPLCGGRRIGQKWTANGQEYMVGANGERLRFTTVKESRKRYYMPKDSKHADNLHMVEVFVEKWLNEEQYAKAKADGLLAWQENENLPKDVKVASTDKAPEGKENQGQEERPRAVSTTAITVSRAQRAANTVWNTPGQSPLTSHSLTNPFNTPPSATTPEASGPRRIRYSMGTLPPTSTSSRAISPMGGFTFAPTPAATPLAPAPSTSSPFGAPTPKPATNAFSFNSVSATANGSLDANPAPGGFSFGVEAKPAVAPTTSGFGNTAATSSNVFGNGASTTPNVFGNNTSGTTSAGFGSGFGSNNGTGAASSPFAFSANKPAGATTTTSGFGTQTATPAAPAFGAQTAAPASFKFGETTGSTTAAPAPGTSGFSFGAPKPTLSIPATNSFGASSSATPTATNAGFTFGTGSSAPAPAGAAASPATPSKPLFNLGAAASPVMGTRQISTSKRVQRAMSKPPQ
ncbi:hypothetical protein FRC07_014658 [Ceratobasidium sp. 392]|nr:hypothetical protein FRC07_014658 [Ceratobasidium sp. 392]